MAELDIRELKEAVDAIFDHILNDVKVDKLTIQDDRGFYWEVPADKLHAVKGTAPKLDIGKLADDWEFLRSVCQDKRQAVALMFAHVAPLLRHIGQEIGQ